MAGRGRGRTMPAWMKDGGEEAPMMSIPPSSTRGMEHPYPQTRPQPQPMQFGISAAAEDGPRLPAGWAEATAMDGRKYWYNSATSETTWQFPRETGTSDKDAATADVEETWKEYVSGDGRTYYHNPTTGETRWEKPTEIQRQTSAPISEATVGNVDSAPIAAAAAGDDQMEDGWIEYKNPEGKCYYHNPATNETRWEKPMKKKSEAAALAPQATAAATASKEAAKPVDSSQRDQAQPAASEEWKEYETEDGRVYYHNTRTRITQWTKPDELGGTKEETPTPKAASVPVKKTEPAKPTRRRGTVQRPRNEKGHPLSDKKAEIFFVGEAERRRRKSVILDMMQYEGMDLDQRSKVFRQMLDENGINAESRWLETMKKCAGDPRYKVLPKYGLRYNAFVIFKSQAKKKQRTERILQVRKSRDEFTEMLEEHLSKEDDRVRSLDDCSPAAVRLVEADPRYLAVEETGERRDMVRSYFIERARRAKDAVRRKRKNNMAGFRAALDAKAAGEKPVFHERTSFREVCDVMTDDPFYKLLDDVDKSLVYDTWQKELEAQVMEARAKEKERKRAADRERRAAFRKGVEELVFSGKLGTKASWKQAEPILRELSWYNDDQGGDFRPTDLFADVMDSILEKITASKDKFKRTLKELDMKIEHNSEFDNFWQKAAPAFEAAKIMEVPARELFEQQKEKAISIKRKEEKKIELAKEDFWVLLRRKEFGASSTWSESTKSVLSARSVYKEILGLGGEELAQRLFLEYVAHRKEREEKRKKRHRNEDETPSAQNGSESKRSKVDDEKEKLDALERRKKEILEQLKAGGDAAATVTAAEGGAAQDTGEVEEGEVDAKR